MIEEKVDLHLIAQVKKGNKQAFNALVVKYQYKIFKIISRYVSDPSEVMDVAQESFIKAFNALEHFRGESAFYTWLYRIAINTAKNHVISQGKKIPDIDFEITDMEQFVARGSMLEFGTPEKLLMCDEVEVLLYDVIEDLPVELQTAILLREIEGLTYEEIANVMHCPVGTVRSRIYRARDAIDRRVLPFIEE